MNGIEATQALKARWLADKSRENVTAYDTVLYAYDNGGHWEEAAVELLEYFNTHKLYFMADIEGISDKYTSGEEYYKLCKEIEGVTNDYRLG